MPAALKLRERRRVKRGSLLALDREFVGLISVSTGQRKPGILRKQDDIRESRIAWVTAWLVQRARTPSFVGLLPHHSAASAEPALVTSQLLVRP